MDEPTLSALSQLGDIFSPGKVATAAAALIATWLSLKVLEWLARRLAERSSRYRLPIQRLFPVLRLLLWLGALNFVILEVLEPPGEALVALAASTGLALGLAVQDLVKDVISGVLILVEQPFQVGDLIAAGDHYGEVRRIGLRAVRIQTFDDSTVTLPNSLLVRQAVTTANAGQLHEMVVVEFTLPATVDVARVKALAAEAAACSPYVYLEKPVLVLVEDVFDRTFLSRFKVKAYVLDVRLERLFASDVLERVKGELLARGLISEPLVLGLLAAEGRPAAGPSRSRLEDKP